MLSIWRVNPKISSCENSKKQSSRRGSAVNKPRRVSMRTHVQSLASLKWVKDPTLLWLWCRPAATAPIQPLAWELPYAVGAVLKRQKKEKEVEALEWWTKLASHPSSSSSYLMLSPFISLSFSSPHVRCKSAKKWCPCVNRHVDELLQECLGASSPQVQMSCVMTGRNVYSVTKNKVLGHVSCIQVVQKCMWSWFGREITCGPKEHLTEAGPGRCDIQPGRTEPQTATQAE